MSVLPTPGGPSNNRFAFGLPSELIPNSPLMRIGTISRMTSSCPRMLSHRRFSRRSSFSRNDASIIASWTRLQTLCLGLFAHPLELRKIRVLRLPILFHSSLTAQFIVLRFEFRNPGLRLFNDLICMRQALCQALQLFPRQFRLGELLRRLFLIIPSLVPQLGKLVVIRRNPVS